MIVHMHAVTKQKCASHHRFLASMCLFDIAIIPNKDLKQKNYPPPEDDNILECLASWESGRRNLIYWNRNISFFAWITYNIVLKRKVWTEKGLKKDSGHQMCPPRSNVPGEISPSHCILWRSGSKLHAHFLELWVHAYKCMSTKINN